MTDKLKTRQPTGKPPWPMILIAGAEKTGKSYAAAAASASQLIGRTFWVGVGEDDPDEYGSIPGARFEIVEHDGTFRSIFGAVDAAAAEPNDPARPNLIVLDSATRLWDLLVDDAQAKANSRRKPNATDDAQITMDLWNDAKQKWQNVMLLLRTHRGPSIITSRYELVTVIERGRPTLEKEWKVKAEKNLPYDVGAVIEMPARGEAYLGSVRSLRFKSEPGARVRYDGFTVEKLWTDLGLGEPDSTTPRQHAMPTVTNPNADLLAEIGDLADKAGVSRQQLAADWAESHDGQLIRQATDVGGLELLRDDLAARVKLAGAQ